MPRRRAARLPEQLYRGAAQHRSTQAELRGANFWLARFEFGAARDCNERDPASHAQLAWEEATRKHSTGRTTLEP